MKKIAISLLATLPLWGADGMKIFFDLDTGIEAYRYEEKSVMKIYGPMYRLDAILGFSISSFKMQVEGYYAGHMGRNIYDGALYVPNATTNKTEKIPYSTQSTEWYVGGNFKFGYFFSLSQIKPSAFIYTGMGYRFLRNKVIDKPGVKGSYQRDQSYLYLPVGLDIEIPITDRISLTAITEYRFFLKGKNRSSFSELGYDGDLFFTQEEGLGGRVGVGAKFDYAKMGIKLNLYYDYWFVDSSDKQPLYKNGVSSLTFIEPKNTTKVVGLMAGISF